MFGAFMDMAMEIPRQHWREELQDDAQANQSEMLGYEQRFNSEQAALQRNWATEMSNTTMQRGTRDLLAAGLNPMLAFTRTPASPSGASASSGSGSSAGGSGVGGGPSFASGMHSAAQAELAAELSARAKAETDKINAERDEIIARTPTHAATVQQIQQNITESIERIEDIRQRVQTGVASAGHMIQQAENLRAVLPQIEATVRLLQSQTTQTGALTGKTIEETNELRQRIKENLPEVKRALDILNAQKLQFDQPRQSNEAAAHQSWVGALGTILRVLNPLNNYLR